MQPRFEVKCTMSDTDLDFKLVIRPDTVLRHNNNDISFEQACQLLTDIGRQMTVVDGQHEWLGYGIFHATELWIHDD